MASSGFSIGGVVREWAEKTPDAPALTEAGTTQTWAELYERSQRAAAGIAAEGVGAQDRVAFIDKNGLPYFETLFGGSLVNAVGVAVNWRLAPPEMGFVINDAQAKVLFVAQEFLGHLEAFEADLDSVTKIVVIGGGHDTHESYEDWMARQIPTDPHAPTADDDVSMQLYTSGTTGLPKGVMLTNLNLSGLGASAAQLEIAQDSVNLVAMPLFHIGGSGWALFGMANGVHSVVIRDIDPALILQLIPEHRITHAFIVPAVLLFLTMVPGVDEVDYSSLQMIAYGASPISEDLLVRCLRTFGCGFYQLYGLTETTGAVTMLSPEDHLDEAHRERLRSAGKPMDGVELRIVDALTGEDVDDGAVGEVWIRSAQVMKGYWKKPDATAESITGDGWFHSGDAGYIVDGYLYLHDRVKDMIVTGGENVYPAEVENALMRHEAVADVAVIGVPSERWGEEVKAIVVPAKDVEVTAEDLIAFARTQLAGFKTPKSVDFTDALPRNPSGKILKKDLREPFWEGRERRIG
jgi:long-chain acyl-CoA synthetase